MNRSRKGGGARRRTRKGVTEGDAGAQSESEGKDRPPSTLGEWVRAGAWALVLFFIIRTFILQTFVIISGSMENTLLIGDFLVVNRAAVGTRVPFTDFRIPGYSSPKYGDVLVFDPPHEEGIKLVKRLVGMPGDTLEMRDGALLRNGTAVDEPYIYDTGDPDLYSTDMDWQLAYLLPGRNPVSEYRPTRDNWGPLELPDDRYFMMGDHRDNSQDSRYWGLLEGWRLEGRVSFIYYSYDSDWKRPFAFIRNIRPGRILDRIR